MKATTAALAFALLAVCAPLAGAADHIAPAAAVAERLQEAATQRDQDTAAVRAVLATPEAQAAAAALGVDVAAASARLGTLSDAELAELAARAGALSQDPVAGAMTRQQWTYILIGAAAVIVLLILI